MRQYLDLLKRIRRDGKPKHPTRAGSGATKNSTVGLPNLHFSHDLVEGFPLLTTRRLNWAALVGELRSFLEGATTHEEFARNGCQFWRPWANWSRDPNGYLGPVYGAQWRRGGQLDHVLKCLRDRPTDRRMVVSAWLPDQIPEMVLPPCHLMWVVTPYDGRLNLSWILRSCDFPIGVPYNIASYALLTHLLAAWAGMEAGSLDCIFCDAHVYLNQLPGVDDQLSRVPGVPPSVRVWFDTPGDFFSWRCDLVGYEPMPNVNFGEVEV